MIDDESADLLGYKDFTARASATSKPFVRLHDVGGISEDFSRVGGLAQQRPVVLDSAAIRVVRRISEAASIRLSGPLFIVRFAGHRIEFGGCEARCQHIPNQQLAE